MNVSPRWRRRWEAIGEPGLFPFPAPPLPVAGFDAKAEYASRAGGAAKKPANAARPPGLAGAPVDEGEDDSASDSGAPTPPPAAPARIPVAPPVRKA